MDNCGGDAVDSIEALPRASDGIELWGFKEGLRDPEGDPGREGVGVACLERERE